MTRGLLALNRIVKVRKNQGRTKEESRKNQERIKKESSKVINRMEKDGSNKILSQGKQYI